MNKTDVIMARVYLTEGDKLFRQLIDFLHNDEQVCGVTAFRGIAGFGRSGKVHEASLVDLTHSLPLVIEFYDRPEKAHKIIKDLNQFVGPGHIVWWPASVNIGE